jgi:hypothetical protein
MKFANSGLTGCDAGARGVSFFPVPTPGAGVGMAILPRPAFSRITISLSVFTLSRSYMREIIRILAFYVTSVGAILMQGKYALALAT